MPRSRPTVRPGMLLQDRDWCPRGVYLVVRRSAGNGWHCLVAGCRCEPGATPMRRLSHDGWKLFARSDLDGDEVVSDA